MNSFDSLVKSVRNDIERFLDKLQDMPFNECALQLALAQSLMNSKKYENVYLEYYVPVKLSFGKPDRKVVTGYVWESRNDQKLYVDIVVSRDEKYVPIEVKFKTCSIPFEWRPFNGKVKCNTLLSDQNAQDHGRYDFWKDVRRLELINSHFEHAIGGLAVFVTNDDKYKEAPGENNNDAKFGMEGGKSHGREIWWNDTEVKEGTTTKKENDNDAWKKREQARPSFTLDNEYQTVWTEMENMKGFSYTIVTVPPHKTTTTLVQ